MILISRLSWFLFLGIVLALISKEILFINEELLVIFSFLLFLVLSFRFVGKIIAKMLDDRAEDLLLKLDKLFKLQVDALLSLKRSYMMLDEVSARILPLIGMSLASLTNIEDDLNKAVSDALEVICSRILVDVLFSEIDLFKEIYEHIIEEVLSQYVAISLLQESNDLEFQTGFDSAMSVQEDKLLVSSQSYFLMIILLNGFAVEAILL